MRIVSGSLISPANFSTLWLGLAPLIPHGFSMVRSTQRSSTGLGPDTPRGHGVVDNFSMIIVGHLGLLQAYSIHHPTTLSGHATPTTWSTPDATLGRCFWISY